MTGILYMGMEEEEEEEEEDHRERWPMPQTVGTEAIQLTSL